MQPSSTTPTTPSSLESLGSCDSGFRADRISDGECTIALTVSVLFSESFMKSLLEMGLKKLLMLLPAAAAALAALPAAWHRCRWSDLKLLTKVGKPR